MRYVAVVIFVLVLAAPFVVRRAVIPARKGEDSAGVEARLVIITPHNPDIRNEFARAFRQWHQQHYGSAATLDYRVPGGTNDIKRQLEATYRSRADNPAAAPPDFQIVWGGGDYFFNQLKKNKILTPMHMGPALAREFHDSFPQPMLAGVRLYDSTAAADGTPTPMWVGVCLSSFGVCYNPDVYHAMGMALPSAEHGWSDLTDPRLSGMLALADPAHSASAGVAYQMVIQHKMAEAEATLFARRPRLKTLAKKELAGNAEYAQAMADGWHAGMSELLKIAANASYFTDSSTLVPMDVSRGESAAGIAIDFYARVTEESAGSDRIRFFAPLGATAITPDPVAILAGATGPKLELAEHFIEFLLSREGQLLWILKPRVPGGPIDRSLRRPPVRKDLYADRADWVEDSDPFTEARGFNQRGEWMSFFDDTRPIWVAAWIDSRDALRGAYTRILAVDDPQRRQSLIDDLANLPVTLADIREISKKAADARDLDFWRAQQQVAWAQKFRKHYEQVESRAR